MRCTPLSACCAAALLIATACGVDSRPRRRSGGSSSDAPPSGASGDPATGPATGEGGEGAEQASDAGTPPLAPEESSDASGSDAGSTTPSSDLLPPVYSGDVCPELVEGLNEEFASGDQDRSLRVVLPPEPMGAPVLYTWHWLGGDAQQIVTMLGYDRLAQTAGIIVVAPESDGHPYEWHTDALPRANPDLTFFDDILACLHGQFHVDLARIYSTGMSAGGLWTSYLTLFRADRLAATAPLSGGVLAAYYVPPAEPIPVILTWGGPTDVYGPFSFDQASRDLSAALREDGHFVVECVHEGGHTVPPGAAEYTWRFLEDHPRGRDGNPYAEGLPNAFPTGCRVAP